MNDKFSINIQIPNDDDGFVLLKCEHCGNYFKARPSDIEDDRVLHIYCPSCGLISESYFTEDVIDLANSMLSNYINDMIYDAFKKVERHNNHGPISFKVGKKPSQEPEEQIRSGIEALEVVSFPCCNREAKIKPILKMTGCYCPFCGVKQYEFK